MFQKKYILNFIFIRSTSLTIYLILSYFCFHFSSSLLLYLLISLFYFSFLHLSSSFFINTPNFFHLRNDNIQFSDTFAFALVGILSCTFSIDNFCFLYIRGSWPLYISLSRVYTTHHRSCTTWRYLILFLCVEA